MPKTKFSQESFQILLSQLDSDVEKAGEIYLNLHRRLTMFFSKRSCASKDIDELRTENRAKSLRNATNNFSFNLRQKPIKSTT